MKRNNTTVLLSISFPYIYHKNCQATKNMQLSKFKFDYNGITTMTRGLCERRYGILLPTETRATIAGKAWARKMIKLYGAKKLADLFDL